MVAAAESPLDESREALRYTDGAATRTGRAQAEACRHDLPVTRPSWDSSDMDKLKSLFSSEQTPISAKGPDSEPPSYVVDIGVW